MLQLVEVSKSFGGSSAVTPLSLDIERGRTTVLIGPSGSGKSTVLRMMIGLVIPDGGHVTFDGTRLTRENVREIRRRMGYVIQDGGLFPHLTASKNATLVAEYLGLDKKKLSQRLDELVTLTKLPPECLHKYPAQLSGGQKQRVSLMRALMLDPDILLLDEPMGALDPMIRSELQNDLRDIFRALEKATCIVTHDLAEAAFFGDTIVLMRNGSVVQKASFRELFEKPADPFVTAFLNAQRILPS